MEKAVENVGEKDDSLIDQQAVMNKINENKAKDGIHKELENNESIATQPQGNI